MTEEVLHNISVKHSNGKVTGTFINCTNLIENMQSKVEHVMSTLNKFIPKLTFANRQNKCTLFALDSLGADMLEIRHSIATQRYAISAYASVGEKASLCWEIVAVPDVTKTTS